MGMTVGITGICGFAGSEIAIELARRLTGSNIRGIDNLSRRGSETTPARLRAAGIAVKHGDIRCAADLEGLGPADWVIDAAANPSVLAGIDGRTSSRQTVDHNLAGTLNVLEYCKTRTAGLVLLSTSRVFSISALTTLPLMVRDRAFVPDPSRPWPTGASAAGVSECFSTTGPLSLYGATKLASEVMAVEYGAAFGFPVIVNRCGLLGGAGQFGTAEQGIFSYWVHAWASGRPLKYLGFAGTGHQVRDVLHPSDLASLVERQLHDGADAAGIWNVGGGRRNAMSLAQLSDWCAARFGPRSVNADDGSRRWDVPWLVMDSARAGNRFGWRPTLPIEQILDGIAEHHRRHPDWLALSEPL
jgi:CDP-paratose 2-epimerase